MLLLALGEAATWWLMGAMQTAEVHQRSADRMLWLCFQNKGLYIKVGQYLSTLHHAIPQEYLQTLKARLPFDGHCTALH